MTSEKGKLVPLASGADDEVTVYVKGFLAAREEAAHFGNWHETHRALVGSHGWGTAALGWTWAAGDWLAIPIPVASGAKLALDVYRSLRHARVAALATTAGFAVAEIGGRFLAQYLAAQRRAAEEADGLAEEFKELGNTYARVRVVAHSLGCRQVVEAAALLETEDRPSEIHLCAPAFVEDEVAPRLAGLARERTYLYYAPGDLVLGLAFPLVAGERALGVRAPRKDYAGLVALDVSEHFGFFVHGEYKNRFAEFAMRKEAA